MIRTERRARRNSSSVERIVAAAAVLLCVYVAFIVGGLLIASPAFLAACVADCPASASPPHSRALPDPYGSTPRVSRPVFAGSFDL